ncbi:MAG: Nif3-like dinuclear metal center hexameric protein [Clostridia bacterium]|nr:Nif3-like dinuclear metal center hexameric protein [Clostridia bacterium]
MPKIRDIIKRIEEFAPLESQCDFDNSGLLYGDPDKNIEAVLVTLDTNCEVVAEAIKKGCGLIVEHHPTLFYPIKKIDLNHPKHRALCDAIQNEIAIYSAHTNIDFAKGGLNDRVAEKLGCEDSTTLDGTPYSARIGKLPKTYTLAEFAKRVALVLQDANVATVGDPNMQVRVIAVANGAGGGSEETILQAKEAGADIFITSELKYNVVRLAKDINYGIISVGHYDSEICFTELICDVIGRRGLGIKVYPAESLKNPFNDRSI